MASKVVVEGEEMDVQDAVNKLVGSLNAMSVKNKLQEKDNQELRKQIHDLSISNDGIGRKESNATDFNLPGGPRLDLVSAISPFSGEKEAHVVVQEFLDSIEGEGEICLWTELEIIQVAKLKLTGLASRYVKSEPKFKTLARFKDFKQLLLSRFEERLYSHFCYDELAQAKQKRGD